MSHLPFPCVGITLISACTYLAYVLLWVSPGTTLYPCVRPSPPRFSVTPNLSPVHASLESLPTAVTHAPLQGVTLSLSAACNTEPPLPPTSVSCQAPPLHVVTPVPSWLMNHMEPLFTHMSPKTHCSCVTLSLSSTLVTPAPPSHAVYAFPPAAHFSQSSFPTSVSH